ncbi:uncharacterized protein METZ01_LOCUS390372 [marine metagenome]|uniref:Uncharacterized protein n=1 Tax=marine metagenome TaxID=408172 RepID=A0A382UV02_9ZZZZ
MLEECGQYGSLLWLSYVWAVPWLLKQTALTYLKSLFHFAGTISRASLGTAQEAVRVHISMQAHLSVEKM